MPIVETERLILRPVSVDDASDMFEYISDKEVCKYMFQNYHEQKEVYRFIKTYYLAYRQRCVPQSYAIVFKENKKMIGTCDFNQIEDDVGEIGFVLNKKYWNQGLMSEAIVKLLEVGFYHLNLRRIEVLHDVRNIACEKVVKKCGFQYEGCMREKMILQNSPCDIKMYAILKNDYMEMEDVE